MIGFNCAISSLLFDHFSNCRVSSIDTLTSSVSELGLLFLPAAEIILSLIGVLFAGLALFGELEILPIASPNILETLAISLVSLFVALMSSFLSGDMDFLRSGDLRARDLSLFRVRFLDLDLRLRSLDLRRSDLDLLGGVLDRDLPLRLLFLSRLRDLCLLELPKSRLERSFKFGSSSILAEPNFFARTSFLFSVPDCLSVFSSFFESSFASSLSLVSTPKADLNFSWSLGFSIANGFSAKASSRLS